MFPFPGLALAAGLGGNDGGGLDFAETVDVGEDADDGHGDFAFWSVAGDEGGWSVGGFLGYGCSCGQKGGNGRMSFMVVVGGLESRWSDGLVEIVW